MANCRHHACRPSERLNYAKWTAVRVNYFRLYLREEMNNNPNFSLATDAIRLPYTKEVATYCTPFSCRDKDLDEFFARDALLYGTELLGKTYAWVSSENTRQILGIITLANDSVKSQHIANSAKNRLQRSVPNAKRGINFPAVLIGRLGVSSEFRGKGLNVGSQILDFVKDWFRSEDNKTGCRFIVVDAYNNPRTLHFYEKNGFKPLYKTEKEERDFLQLKSDEPLETRFMFFDLKLN